MKESLVNKLNKLKNSFFIKENLSKSFNLIYLKISELIFLKKVLLGKPLIIGLAGGQGSGKTTFAHFLKLILENKYNLKKPINKLEALEDKNCKWRLKVNQHLKTDYKELFSFIDLMIYLKVPNFNKVLAWRGLQEKKLAYSKKNMSQNKLKIMTESEIKRFIMFYERITKKMLIDMPKFADIIVPISSNHQPKKIILN